MSEAFKLPENFKRVWFEGMNWDGTPMSGYIYLRPEDCPTPYIDESLHISAVDPSEMGGHWYLQIERSELVSDDLAQLERILFEWFGNAGGYEKPETHLRVALDYGAHCDDVDAAFYAVQSALDVDTGDFAGMWASGHAIADSNETWNAATPSERRATLEEYAEAEQAFNEDCNQGASHTDTGRSVCAFCGTVL